MKRFIPLICKKCGGPMCEECPKCHKCYVEKTDGH